MKLFFAKKASSSEGCWGKPLGCFYRYIVDYGGVKGDLARRTGDNYGGHLKGNRFFGDNRVCPRENLLDYKPQNLHYISSLAYYRLWGIPLG